MVATRPGRVCIKTKALTGLGPSSGRPAVGLALGLGPGPAGVLDLPAGPCFPRGTGSDNIGAARSNQTRFRPATNRPGCHRGCGGP